MSRHHLNIEEDDMGFLLADCACGWFAGPFVAQEDVTDCWAEHIEETPRVAHVEGEWPRKKTT
jgi:hypothetical protein